MVTETQTLTTLRMGSSPLRPDASKGLTGPKPWLNLLFHVIGALLLDRGAFIIVNVLLVNYSFYY